MPKFSARSREKLKTCHPRLQKLMHEVIRSGFDIKILEGYRTNERQAQLFFEKKSKIESDGKHNSTDNGVPCSEAVDVLFHPFLRGDWERKDKFAYMAGYIIATCRQMQRDGRLDASFKLVSGTNWDDDLTTDQWFDGPHFEIREHSE